MSSPTPQRWHRELLAGACVVGVAAALRFFRLAGHSLWSDEGNSVALAQHSFAEIARRTAFDIHPPLYYWLLKLWTMSFGQSEVALRSLSALLGVGVVGLVWLLGRRLFCVRVGLLAAFIAALAPLQVYYAQEARMYMLLAFLSSLTVLLAWRIITTSGGRAGWGALLAYGLTVAAGLYTHYAYPLILLVVNGVALIHWRFRFERRLWRWLGLQLLPLLLYLPWLPTAWRQLTTWPSAQITASPAEIGQTIADTLLIGLSWPYQTGLWPAAALLLILAAAVWRWPGKTSTERLALLLLFLWTLLPVLLTVVIFSPAFLKFLLVSTPPLALLAALAIDGLATLGRRRLPGYLLGALMLAMLAGASLLSLFHYYTNPTFARDNYRGIVQFIQAVGDDESAIILNAEGQQDVFNYYYRSLSGTQAPVYPLPRRRPLDEAATLTELEHIANEADKIFAVYWASQQADPAGVIEGWLDRHLYKATDRWFGNVRLVSYAGTQADLAATYTPLDYPFGADIRLTGYQMAETSVTPGDILQVALRWQTETALTEPYTVFLQLLDSANHLVGQRDASPVTPTTAWPVGKRIADTHGIFIEPGTPPGPHRLIVGLYHSQTGQRLPVQTGAGKTVDFVVLGEVVVAAGEPLPIEAFDMQVRLAADLPNLSLLGYDLYKLGHRSTPDTPLHPGDPVRLVAYWQRGQAEPRDGLLTLSLVSSSGEVTSLTEAPLAGVDYPPGRWQPGGIVRAQYDFFLGDVSSGLYRVRLALGEESSIETRPFQVEVRP